MNARHRVLHPELKNLLIRSFNQQIVPLQTAFPTLAPWSTTCAMDAVEKRLGLKIPPSTMDARDAAELNASFARSGWVLTPCDLAPCRSSFCFREREDLLRIYEMVGPAHDDLLLPDGGWRRSSARVLCK